MDVVHPLSGTIAELIWLVPVLPFLGFLINGAFSLTSAYLPGPLDPSSDPTSGHSGHTGEFPALQATHHGHRHRWEKATTIIGPAVIILGFLLSAAIAWTMIQRGGDAPFVQRYSTWMPAGTLQVDWAFQLDHLSMVMVLIITGIGSLIHIFSVGYMREDPGYPRYFAYLNLFVVFMLALVLGANYPVIFVGWEGVGLCSYLLIGFWFSDTNNADAGKKAFIVNRVGDFGFLIAMFLLWSNLGALDFAGVAAKAATFPVGSGVITAICLFLFLGCAGKSAQMPLYIWLPDAMAGPTPVSALIHAATMVTAGVYLIARSSFLFAVSPTASLTVVIVGGVTAIFAASIALKQWDIKKVLAYSTVSQLGYMFVGVGAGAYTAGVFHLVTHAFFKALLFLGSGSIIHAMHEAYHEGHAHHDDAQDMRNMGGLRHTMPFTWAFMWIATLAIAGVPVFSGFFSKDEILGQLFERAHGSTLADAHWFGIPGSAILYLFYGLGLITAFMTAIYMTRMMLYTFHGENRSDEKARPHLHEAPWIMTGPLAVLAVLSAVGGWVNLPEWFTEKLPVGRTEALHHWLEPVVGHATTALAGAQPPTAMSTELSLVAAAIACALGGILTAWLLLKPAKLTSAAKAPAAHGVARVLERKYFVDELIQMLLVNPVIRVSRTLLWRGIDVGLIDGLMVNGSASVARGIAWVGARAQSGLVGNYAWAIALGVLGLVAVMTLG